MTTFFNDGAALPSFLAGYASSAHLMNDGSHTNISLRVGEVVGVVNGGDAHHWINAYTVLVLHQDGKRLQTPTTYWGCTVLSLFGGTADYSRYTLRPRSVQPTKGNLWGNGSKVLLACVNGRTTQAWIIGGVLDSSLTANGDFTQTPADTPIGTNYNAPQLEYIFNYNGVAIEIDPKGEYSVSTFGPTDASGNSPDGQPVALIKLDSSSNILLQSEGVLTGDATDNTVLGSTYIEAEKSALDDFVSNMQQVAQDLAAAGSGLMTVAPPAGTALTKASADLLTALEPLSNFTSNSDDYLSKKNLSD